MRPLHADLILLASIALAYGLSDGAHTLYLLSQLGADGHMTMTAGDMQAGLGLLGLDCAHYVGGHQDIPPLVVNSIDAGHVVLAQFRDRTAQHAKHWCALCTVQGNEWRGVSATGEYASQSESSTLGSLLTGHYIIVARTLPGWHVLCALEAPHLN